MTYVAPTLIRTVSSWVISWGINIVPIPSPRNPWAMLLGSCPISLSYLTITQVNHGLTSYFSCTLSTSHVQREDIVNLLSHFTICPNFGPYSTTHSSWQLCVPLSSQAFISFPLHLTKSDAEISSFPSSTLHYFLACCSLFE